MENTNIEWATHTFNPWEGCQKVGPGCDNCYAEARNKRFGGGVAVNWGPGAPRRRTSAANWRKPLAWNANHNAFFAENGYRQRVFCSSLADMFDNAVDPEWRDELFKLILATPNLDWLLLTKRIGNVGNMLPVPFDFDKHYPNVWIGATIVNQDEADRDIPKLLAVPAAKRFLSMEPLLGPVDLHLQREQPCTMCVSWNCELHGMPADPPCLRRVDWVIVGGESGPGARPMHPDWPRSLRDECHEAGVPFMFKQWGEWLPVYKPTDADDVVACFNTWPKGRWVDADGGKTHRTWNTVMMDRVGKKAAGRLLDGREWNGVPT